MNQQLDLSVDINQVRKSVSLKKTVLTAAIALGVMGTVTPILIKNLDRESKTLLLLSGLIGNITACLLPKDTRDEKLKTTYDKIATDNFKSQLQHEVVRVNAITEVREKNILANFIDNETQVPWFQKAHWAKKFGVVELVTSFFVDSEMQSQEETAAPEQVSNPIPLSSATLTKQLELVSNETEIDLSWVTPIVPQSKILVGGKGSGKSRFMRFLVASYITSYPNDDWLILDPHYGGYEEDDFDCQNPDHAWLLGIPPEELKHKIYDNVPVAYTILMKVKATLRDRISRKLKYPKVPRLMVFMDELEAFRRDLSDDQVKEVIELIDVIQDEGRKFGVEITLGCHSLKKERIGLDSTVISQMNWILLEKGATDSSTKFPADFDQKAITKKVKEVNGRKDKTKHRTMVLTTPSGDYLVDLLPMLPLPSFATATATDTVEPQPQSQQPQSEESTEKDNGKLTRGQKAYKLLQDWVRDREQPPTSEEVSRAWERLAEEKLTPEYLAWLMGQLGL